MVQPQLVKIGGPWTRSMIRGSMDPVHILMDPVHGPGPQRAIFDRDCTFKWVIVSIFHLTLWVDPTRAGGPSWSGPTFVEWQVIAFHNHNNFVGGWNCNKASDIWKFSQIGRVVLKADFEKTGVKNTVVHRVHRFSKEKTTQIKKIPCKHKIHIEKNISSTLQKKLKLYQKYAHCK